MPSTPISNICDFQSSFFPLVSLSVLHSFLLCRKYFSSPFLSFENPDFLDCAICPKTMNNINFYVSQTKKWPNFRNSSLSHPHIPQPFLCSKYHPYQPRTKGMQEYVLPATRIVSKSAKSREQSRPKTGSFTSPQEWENLMQWWLKANTIPDNLLNYSTIFQ